MAFEAFRILMNDLVISFISHKCYTGDFELIPADKYQNTREILSKSFKQEKTESQFLGTATLSQSQFLFQIRAPKRPRVGFKAGDIYLQIPPIKPQLDK